MNSDPLFLCLDTGQNFTLNSGTNIIYKCFFNTEIFLYVLYKIYFEKICTGTGMSVF